MKLGLSLIAATLVLSACSSTPPQPQVSAPPAATPAVKTVVAPAPANDATQEEERVIKALASNSVFFDYDKFNVKPEYMDLLKKNYELMKANPKLTFMIEGNADERGTAEYNLALGQKRAEAVRKALVILGVPEAQLEATSYGSQKPRASCHEEKCWAENRRVDFAGKKQ